MKEVRSKMTGGSELRPVGQLTVLKNRFQPRGRATR